LTARQLEELVRRDLGDHSPRPSAQPRRERTLKPDVQQDLDALLGAIMADLDGGSGAK
jgi:hypothetical protein